MAISLGLLPVKGGFPLHAHCRCSTWQVWAHSSGHWAAGQAAPASHPARTFCQSAPVPPPSTTHPNPGPREDVLKVRVQEGSTHKGDPVISPFSWEPLPAGLRAGSGEATVHPRPREWTERVHKQEAQAPVSSCKSKRRGK